MYYAFGQSHVASLTMPYHLNIRIKTIHCVHIYRRKKLIANLSINFWCEVEKFKLVRIQFSNIFSVLSPVSLISLWKHEMAVNKIDEKCSIQTNAIWLQFNFQWWLNSEFQRVCSNFTFHTVSIKAKPKGRSEYMSKAP